MLVGEKPVNFDAVLEVSVLSESDLHDALRAIGIEAGPAVAVPLRGRETESGLLWIFEDGRPFDANEIERIRLIAGHAQLALHNAERYSHAQERAFVDDVTEVYNARYLLQATEHEIQRAERYGKKLSVLFLDLDRFKLVNDRYGHLVGSQVLRQLSEVLAGCIRQVDTLARYGGDEFTILLIDTDLEVGLAVAERIRRDGGRDAFRRRPRLADPPRDQHRGRDLSRPQRAARRPARLRRQGDVPRQIPRPQSRLLRLGARGVSPGRAAAGGPRRV